MTFPDADLHAFVDGQLAGRELEKMRLRLSLDQVAATRAARWAAGREELRARLTAAVGPTPLRLDLSRRTPRLELDAGRSIFAAGFLAGFMAALAAAAALFLRL